MRFKRLTTFYAQKPYKSQIMRFIWLKNYKFTELITVLALPSLMAW